MTDWYILRVAGSGTLRLASSLNEAGFGCWCPVEVREVLIGRKREPVEKEIPILPEYVFAKSENLHALLALSHSPSLNYRVWDKVSRKMVDKGHPPFSVFRVHGRYHPVTDASLSPMRALEARLAEVAERRRQRALTNEPLPKFAAGEVVRVDGGGFEGLQLTVAEANEGKMVKLVHPAWMWTVEISAWKLRDVQLSQGSHEQVAA